MATKTRPPAGLKAAGRRLWSSIVDDFDLDEHESTLLLQACRTADLLDDIASGLNGATLTVTGERGGERPHPLLAEHSRASLTLSRLLASLRLPSGDEDERPQRRGSSRRPYGIRGSVQ